MSSSLYGTGDLPYYMGVIFDKKDPHLDPRTDMWPSPPPRSTARDGYIDVHDPLERPLRCCTFDGCGCHNIDRTADWWMDYKLFKKNRTLRVVASVRSFLRTHDVHCHTWIVMKMLTNSTDLATVAIDPVSCRILVDVLRGIMRNLSTTCNYPYLFWVTPSDRYPEILRDLSSVWLSLNCKAFYTMMLPSLVKELPHLSHQSNPTHKMAPRLHITKSTVLIVLQRISHDFLALMHGDCDYNDVVAAAAQQQACEFYEVVMRNDDWLIGAFMEAMEKCIPVAVLLSLFVPKATVLAACRAFLLQTRTIKWHDLDHASIGVAFRYMTLARMSPSRLRATVAATTTDDAGDNDFFSTKAGQLLSELDAHISQEGLAARSLLALLRMHGIAWVVRYFRENRVMPLSIWTIIHRYFYGTSWRFVYVMDELTTMPRPKEWDAAPVTASIEKINE